MICSILNYVQYEEIKRCIIIFTLHNNSQKQHATGLSNAIIQNAGVQREAYIIGTAF